MRLLLDMNMSPLWVDALEAAGHTAIHWSYVGSADASDDVISAYAQEHAFVIVTQDLDFGIALAVSGARSPSVVQLRAPDALPNAIGKSVMDGLQKVTHALTAGALVTIDTRRTRVRVLPIRRDY